MNEQIARVLYHRWTIPASVGVVSFAAGATVGYILGKRSPHIEEPESPSDGQLEFDFNSESFISDTETFYKSFADLKEERKLAVVNPNHPSVVEEDVEIDEDIETDEPAIVSIFRNTDDDWDMEAELNSRTSEAPYIIHVEEFQNDEMGYAQLTITYYAGDDILTDDRDVPIYNKTEVVGELKFGHGSKDQNACYVRNERLHAEYEVLLSHGRYEEEILGLSIESEYEERDLKHSNHKFRDE